MTANNSQYPQHPNYKDSGVDWLGQIPAHWGVRRLGAKFEERKTKVSDKKYPALSVTKNGILPQLANAAKTNDGDNRKLVKKGDFVINSRSDRKGSSGISDRDGSVSLINTVITPIDIHPIFCHYLLRTHSFVEEFYKVGHGIVADLWTTRYDEMKKIVAAFPPLAEQQQIADYLDHKTALIEKAVALKQQQIALLQERLQILIQNAVTKGLNPQAPLKNSNIDWLGQIPAHWEVKKIKHVFEKIQTGTTPSTNNEKYFSGTINWYTPCDLNNSYLKQASKKISELALQDGQSKLFPKKSILIVGIGATSGKTAYLDHNASFNQQITGFNSKNEHSLFMYYLISSMSNVLLSLANYTTLPILNNEFFKNLVIAIPPIAEQQQIADYLDKKSTETEQAIALINQQIKLLQEYKNILINEAVTGKIDLSHNTLGSKQQ